MIVVDSEKNHKKEGANAFVAIIKGVIFDDKIEEIGSFFGNGGVNILAIKSLSDSAE